MTVSEFSLTKNYPSPLTYSEASCWLCEHCSHALRAEGLQLLLDGHTALLMYIKVDLRHDKCCCMAHDKTELLEDGLH